MDKQRSMNESPEHNRDTEEHLVAELELLGVRYLSRLSDHRASQVRPPAILLSDEVRQPSPRVRAAVIAVLLAHPEYAGAVPRALERLEPDEAFTLRAFYAAATLLQRQNSSRLRALMGARWQPLPDLDEVTTQLNLPSRGTTLEKLAALAGKHQRQSQKMVNWTGSYQQVARHLIRSWEVERLWEQ
jgi:hypothetical protein